MPVRPESLHEARSTLQSIAGILGVAVDDAEGIIVLFCGAEAAAESIAEAAREALAGLGLEEGDVRLELVCRLSDRQQQRVRFVGVRREERPDHRVDVTVTLEWNQRTASATVTAERAEPLELRAVAMAALDAVRQLVPEPGQLDLRVAGVKQVRSFDAELMVASLFRPGVPPQQFVGAVVVGGDVHRAAAVAVLSSLNRLLGNYLAR